MDKGILPFKLHFFVCTNDRSTQIPERASCGTCISKETIKDVKNWLTQEKLNSKVKISRTHCLGLCNKEGGALTISPSMKFVKGFRSSEEIKEIILDELEK